MSYGDSVLKLYCKCSMLDNISPVFFSGIFFAIEAIINATSFDSTVLIKGEKK